MRATARMFACVNNISLRNSPIITSEGPKHDDVKAREFILKVYLRENPDPDRMCYSHFTCATGQDFFFILLYD